MQRNFFSNKVVVITGSSMGIGKSLAILLGQMNAKIVLNGRNEQKLFETEAELKSLGCDVIAVSGDVTIENDCIKLIETAIAHHGRIDVLVNNAGMGMRGRIAELTPSVVNSIFAINAVAPIMLTKIALPYIIKARGSLIYISSLAGLRGLPLLSVYSAAKMSLAAFTQALRSEHYHDYIHVGLVYVGITQIEEGKTALGADGNNVLLDKRKKSFTVKTTDEVAGYIATNISSRKKETVIGLSGKIYFVLVKLFPRLFGWLLIIWQKKIDNVYK